MQYSSIFLGSLIPIFELSPYTFAPVYAASNSTVPARFIAKQHTKRLGHVPSQPEWNLATSYFQFKGCSAITLRTTGQQIYTELTTDYSDNAARVLALYRGVLNRNPDQGGLNTYVS